MPRIVGEVSGILNAWCRPVIVGCCSCLSDSEARYAGPRAIFLSINQGLRLMMGYHDIIDDYSGIGREPRGSFRCDVMMRDTLPLPSS